MVNPRVYMDIATDGKSLGRIVIELFADTTPRTAESFRVLCTGEKGKRLHYKGLAFERLSTNLCFGGGDINAGEKELETIYGVNPEPENFIKKHDKPGIISILNSKGPGFYILERAMGCFNCINIVVGRVVEGIEIVKAFPLFSLGTLIVIADCGQLS